MRVYIVTIVLDKDLQNHILMVLQRTIIMVDQILWHILARHADTNLSGKPRFPEFTDAYDKILKAILVIVDPDRQAVDDC